MIKNKDKAMKVQEFLNTKKVSQKDKDVCIRVYGDTEKDAKAWEKELAGRVDFSEKKAGTEAPKDKKAEAAQAHADKKTETSKNK